MFTLYMLSVKEMLMKGPKDPIVAESNRPRVLLLQSLHAMVGTSCNPNLSLEACWYMFPF